MRKTNTPTTARNISRSAGEDVQVSILENWWMEWSRKLAHISKSIVIVSTEDFATCYGNCLLMFSLWYFYFYKVPTQLLLVSYFFIYVPTYVHRYDYYIFINEKLLSLVASKRRCDLSKGYLNIFLKCQKVSKYLIYFSKTLRRRTLKNFLQELLIHHLSFRSWFVIYVFKEMRPIFLK